MGYPSPYVPPPPPAPHYPPTSNGVATASLTLGILACVLPFTGIGAVIMGVLAVIFGPIGMGNAKRGAPNHGRALAGLILGIAAVIPYIIWGVLTGGLGFIL